GDSAAAEVATRDAGESGEDSGSAGALARLRVFVSYARPQATALAQPVERALRSLGAEVWFDQNAELDAEKLDAGLSQTIGDCDAYVMCASDEFIERGGYATQELASALANDRPQRRLRYFMAVVEPGTVLPSAIAEWPSVIFAGDDERELARSLALA